MIDFSDAAFPRIGVLSLEHRDKFATLRLDTRRRTPSAKSCLLDTAGLLQYTQLLQWLIGESLTPSRLWLGYTDHSLAKSILPFFGTLSVTVATHYGISFGSALLDRPIIRRSNEIDEYIETLPGLLIGVSAEAPHVRHQVRACIESAFERGEIPPTLPELASTLAMSESTFRRRLRREGGSYSTLLEDCRRACAQRYLERTDLPIETIAWRLGFGDASAFRRAFRRWTGSSPSCLRHASGGEWLVNPTVGASAT
jgi:AraC-like DNA-binding protein